jgi:electron transfer flavoprotein alpha subunit
MGAGGRLRIAVLVKQVPTAESMALRADGRIERHGVELEMNAYCRRAVTTGVALAREHDGACVVFTLGPEAAEDVLREAIAWGADEGVLVTDPAFVGSDTLATARALAGALTARGPWDLVLVGRNSIDADTGQVGPELAELLDLPFAPGVRELTVVDGVARVRSELDDGWRVVDVALPALLSTAERLCDPCKVPPEGRAAVDAARIARVAAATLGAGPWGQDGSPTRVGPVRVMDVDRRGVVLSGDVGAQVDEAARLLRQWGAIEEGRSGAGGGTSDTAEPAVDPVAPGTPGSPAGAGPAGASALGAGAPVVVVIEPGRERMARELLGEAGRLAPAVGGRVVAFGPEPGDPDLLATWGAERVVAVTGAAVEEDVAAALATWSAAHVPWAVLAPGTLWGREVAARAAARLGAGLTGDAVGFGVEDGRLVAWKPAFGGRLVAGITATSPVQMATVRPGILAERPPRRTAGAVAVEVVAGSRRGRVTVVDAGRDDEVEVLMAAHTVVGVGQGVPPEEYAGLDPLLKVLGAELAASRKVTDRSWLPRARQVGITGHSIAPALYVAIGISGKFNHMVGARGAGTILAVNSDPEAPVFAHADLGIVGDWREVVPRLAQALA